MRFIARNLVLAAGLALVGASPALAASPITRAFLANVVPNVDFLDRSSRFALTNTKSNRVHAFALAEAREQTHAADALYDWTQADGRPLVATTSPQAPASDLDQTPTGSTKSAWPALIQPEPTADESLPHGQEDLDSLEGLNGKDFDEQYKDKQADALQQVEAAYRAYLAKGDDPALLTLAKRELPKIIKRRAALAKL